MNEYFYIIHPWFSHFLEQITLHIIFKQTIQPKIIGRKAVLRSISFGFTLQNAVLTVPPVGEAAPPVGDAAPPVGEAVPTVGEAVPPIGDAAPTVGKAAPPVGGAASFAF
jgi:hypothetical protein